MPLLAALFKSIFYALAGFWVNYVSARVALGLAVATVFAAATAALVLTLSGMATGLLGVMPSWVSRAACWFWPDNGNLCIATVLSAMATRWAYDVNRKYLEYTANWR